MFGSKFKIWMENHIGRPKKKVQQEKDKIGGNDGRAIILESSESLAQSDTGISSGSQQVLSSSTTDTKEGYYTTTMESERSGTSHCRTAVSLPSPESAYSTGYSTDGASPGGPGPPEYYINIRTGKHYFPSPAPTPTTPQPNAAFSQLYSNTSFLPNDMTVSSGKTKSSPVSNGHASLLSAYSPDPSVRLPREANERKPMSETAPGYFEIFNFSKSSCKKSQLSTLRLFLKSPKQEKGKLKTDINKTPIIEEKQKILSPGKNKKWYKQPFQKFNHRRTDSCGDGNFNKEIKRNTYLDKNMSYFVAKENGASPRQRNRIKTNPWLPTEPMSSQNFYSLQINFSPSLLRNRSCTNTPLQNRKTNEPEIILDRLKQKNGKIEEPKEYLSSLEKAANRHVAQKLYLELSDHSEEDVTLNEMMGTYNESYVYEKETDILSDSDPTDCEDYISDSEADNGGDEQDSHDDELDFIDNGSVTESEENFKGNTGKCTYHDVYVKKNSFLHRCDGHHSRKGSDCRRSLRRGDSKGKKTKDEKKRKPTRRSLKCDEDDPWKKSEVRAKLNENVGGLNLGRVLVQRALARNETKSAEGTPECIRRQKLTRELRETRIGSEKIKTEVKSKNFLLADPEADKKYNELIMEAENIFESLQNSPVIQSRRKIYLPEIESNSVNIWRKTEAMCCPQYPLKGQEISVKKSPKTLGLRLSVDDALGTPKHLNLDNDKKSSFKAKSSAHSPLDPLGPTFRNFSVFKPTNGKLSSSSSEDSEPCKNFQGKATRVEISSSPIVPIAFQSVDLGKPSVSYCPQSEPVKRKIYSCSKTYNELVKRFENKPTDFEEGKGARARHGSLLSRRRVGSQEPVGTKCWSPVSSHPHSGRKRAGHVRGKEPENMCSSHSPLSSRRENSSGLSLALRRSFDLDVLR